MNQKVSKKELRRVLGMYVYEGQSSHETNYGLKCFHFWVSKHSKQLDDEAMALVSEVSDIYIEHLKKYANEMADEEDKRKIGIAESEHFSFEKIIKKLYQEPDEKLEINRLTRDMILDVGQTIFDFLYDIPKKSIKKDDYVVLTLFHTTIDEILTSFHLAQHKFAPQSLHHSRTVFEIIDLVELFRIQPKLIKFWSDENKKPIEKWKELRPAKVREKLGRKEHDPVYSFMSEIGTHITAYYVKPKVSEEIEIGSGIKKKVTIRLEGSSQDWATVAANTACVHSALMLLNQLAKNYQQYLNEDEVIKTLPAVVEKYKQYFLEGFVKFSRNSGMDTKEVEKFVKNIKIDY